MSLGIKLFQGESLRYRIETETTTKGHTVTPILNPEAATTVKQTTNLIVRLDVLELSPTSSGNMPRARLQMTYEKSRASFESDAYDPQAAALDDQYDHLEGRSVEFTIQPDGRISDITGLEDLLATPSTAQTVRSWMSGISFGAGLPKPGITIGKKWSREEPLAGSPLRGLVWHSESTYLRNEPCAAAPGQNAAPTFLANARQTEASPGVCAAILTRFQIARHGSSHGDATPDDYLRSGLRTSGVWTGSGESLKSISIASGLLVVSTETVSQDMDYLIKSAASGSTLRYKGHVDSRSQISLIPESESQP